MEQAERLDKRITNVVELMNRLTPSNPEAVISCKPLVASAVELGHGVPGDSRQWAIVHSITDYQLQFIHAQSLKAERVALRITSPGGEIVEIVVAASRSQPIGDLFETSARFLGPDATQTPTRSADQRSER